MKHIRKFWYRIKTLYYFWQITKNNVDPNRWIVETGKYPDEDPRGKNWMKIWSEEKYFIANLK